MINDQGVDFKEIRISREKRIYVVITFYNRKYISELKIRDGEEKHLRGIPRLHLEYQISPCVTPCARYAHK